MIKRLNALAKRQPVLMTAVLCTPVGALIGLMLSWHWILTPILVAVALAKGVSDLNREFRKISPANNSQR